MKYYPYLQSKQGKWLLGLFLFALLYITRNTLTAAAVLGIQKAQFLTLGLMGLLGIGFLAVNRQEWKAILTDRRMLLLSVCAAVLLVPMVLKRDWQMMYITILLCLCYGVLFSYFISLRDLARYYVTILSVVGVYSMIAAYLLRLLPDGGLLSVPIIRNVIDVRFYYFGTYVPLTYVKMRNFGLFREPGVYQYYLTLALFLNNYVACWEKERTLWVHNVLLALTLLTTMATGGVAGLGLLVLVVFFEKKLYRNKRVLILAVVLLVVMALVLTIIVMEQGELYWELYGMVIGKFTNNDESSGERIEAVLSDFRFFIQSPLVGGKIAQVLHAVENNTTSTMVMFAIYGILGGLLHVASWLLLVWSRERKLWVNVCLLLIVFLSFNTQNLVSDTFFWLFPMLALTEKVLPRLQK